MARRSKKRKSEGETIYTKPNVKQIHFPSLKRTISDKNPPWSAPSIRQQTITQMDPLRPFYHPDSEDEGLEIDETPTDLYVETPPRTKRRKIDDGLGTPTRSIQTRSVTKVVASAPERCQARKECPETQDAPTEEDIMPCAPRTMTQMLPPKTPQKRFRLEIPSSQSPPDTPLSTQSRNSIRGLSRSPLKEKSSNIFSQRASPLKSVRFAKGTVIADSMEFEDDSNSDSPSTTRKINISQRQTGPSQCGPSEIQVVESSESRNVDQHSGYAVMTPPTTKTATKNFPQSQLLRKEVSNSDKEEDEDDDEDERVDFGPSIETQAALASSLPVPSSVSRDPGLWGYTGTIPNYQQHQSPNPKTKAAKVGQSKESAGSSALQEILSSSEPDHIPSTPITRPQRTESQEASAQLQSEVQRVVKPVTLETDSQAANAWESYQPQALPIQKTEEEALDNNPKSSPPVEVILSSQSMTMPTQPLPIISQNARNRTKATKGAPIPPSQATTVDLTQQSPKETQPSSQPFASSPPPMPPISSSPLAGRKKTDPWAEYEWNGIRLTDSQLLPESLMNDSFLGPPEKVILELEEYE